MTPFEFSTSRSDLTTWQNELNQAVKRKSDLKRHGDLPRWLTVLENLPSVTPSSINLSQDSINIGLATDINLHTADQLQKDLLCLSPWRKGPYDFFNIQVDTEWRSDWKWRRLEPHISSLRNRKVLDVGCGNGYHGWRMLGGEAEYVMGIDPSMLFYMQFLATQKYINTSHFDFLPIGIEDMPVKMEFFDTVFSMGVLYHRRNPLNHLIELKELLSASGELVLETLIIDEIEGGVFYTA